jgi:uncharacterized protein
MAESKFNPEPADDQSEVVTFLSRPDTHGISSKPVRIDTHGAIVFLAGSYAYKMKRAVRFPFLDFSTLEKRRLACEAELELNRPNAPEIYLDTMSITRRDGTLEMGGEGTIVEWLVRMRRFDPADTLDHVAERGALSDKIVADLVDAIAASHERAPIGDGDMATRRLGEWMRGNFDALSASPDIILGARVEGLRRISEDEFLRVTDLLLERGHTGFVRRCHGDLHLRNIVLINTRPILFDALEFDETYATHDLFYDLAFLLMDLWQRDLRGEANNVLNRYLWRGGNGDEIDGCALLPLFMSIRAAIRAKVAISTAAFEDCEAAKRDSLVARHDFAFAKKFLEPVNPRLVAIGGLSGSGKTRMSSLLAPELGRPPGAIHLRSDIERKRMFKVTDTDRLPSSTYSQEMSDAVYARLRDKAARALAAGQSVVVDAVHGHLAERRAIEDVARANNAPFTGIWLEAPDDVLFKRVGARIGDASDADGKVVSRQLTQDNGTIQWRRIDSSRDAYPVASEYLKKTGEG